MNKALYQEIGRRIRSRRKAFHLTQDDLAALCGLARSISISEYEKGKCRIPIDALYIIAEALGTPVCEFLPESEGRS